MIALRRKLLALSLVLATGVAGALSPAELLSRATRALRATRPRLARRDAGRTGTAVVDTQVPPRDERRGGVTVIAARRGIPPTGVVLRDGLRLKQRPRPDAIPEGALREGERVDVIGREGEIVRARTSSARASLASRDVGALTE